MYNPLQDIVIAYLLADFEYVHGPFASVHTETLMLTYGLSNAN